MDALKKDFSSKIEKQTKEMKVMQHELNQSIKSLGIKLDRVETRLEQDIKDVCEDVQADLRNLKNEIVPGLKTVRPYIIFFNSLDVPDFGHYSY
jgi:phage host-nuclease inhibitor protein Gam